MDIGLVLSGGMAKGAYQIGALKALNELIPFEDIKYISCSSVGVLNGYAYATDRLENAAEMWKTICSQETRIVITQMLRSSMLQQGILDICTPPIVPIPVFYCSLFDWSHKSIIYKNLSSVSAEQIPMYLRASVAMPVYNHAVQIESTAYYDGAMIDNIPVYPLLKHNLDYMICIYFDDICYKFENTYFDNKIVKISFPCKSIVKQSLIFRQENIEQMLRDGYDRAKHILQTVLCDGSKNLDSIYRSIDYLNNRSGCGTPRITGDMLVTNLNRVTRKLAKRNIV